MGIGLGWEATCQFHRHENKSRVSWGDMGQGPDHIGPPGPQDLGND